MSPRSGTAGFTLLEVIIATAIFAAAAAVLLPRFGLSARLERAAMTTREALLIARSKLAEAEASPVPGATSGAAPGGYRWTVDLDPSTTAPGGLRAYHATVVVTPDHGGRAVTLETTLLGRAS